MTISRIARHSNKSIDHQARSLQQGSKARKFALSLLLGVASYPLWYRVFDTRIPVRPYVSPHWPAMGASTATFCVGCVLTKSPSKRNGIRKALKLQHRDLETPVTKPVADTKPPSPGSRNKESAYLLKKSTSYPGKIERPKTDLFQVMHTISEELKKNKDDLEKNKNLHWWVFKMEEYFTKLHEHIKHAFDERIEDDLRLHHLEERSLKLAETVLSLANTYLSIIKTPSTDDMKSLQNLGLLRIQCILIQAELSYEHKAPTFSNANISPLELTDTSGMILAYDVAILNKATVFLSLEDVLTKNEQDLRHQLGIATSRII
jgi:hypothetical protein